MSTVIDCLPNIEYNNILVVNALNGVLALLLREKYPNAKIVCAEYFPWFKPFLSKLGFEVLDWDEDIGMKFDLVIGNPPYQNKDNSHFYKQFVDKAKTLSTVVAMVVPSSYFGNTSNFDNTGPCGVFNDDDFVSVEKFAVAPATDMKIFKIVNDLILRGVTGYEINSGDLWRKDAIHMDMW